MPVFNPGVLYTDTRFKITTHTYDMATASGNQTLTGAGFTPKMAVLIGATDAVVSLSQGFSDGTVNYCTFGNGSAGNFQAQTSYCIVLETAPSTYQAGTLTFNSDGGVIAWTKALTPTGTATFHVMWFR